jgi:hypothetical protein
MSPQPTAPSTTDDADKPTRLGKFIQTYHSFLSTFVIGAAGLIATSIWQYKQSEISRRQADSQQHIAATQAENSWRIERAEILSKNLQVLASSGEATVEQRYGVLLSLTRGNILDPELAVSYALELGKDNADYMKSVLANTADKSYARLANAFELTCQQRFGVTRDVPLCKADVHAERSTAIAEVIADETEAAWRLHKPGPTGLLADEREVQITPARLAWLFSPYLSGLYERRQWSEIARFEALSVGARLVGALVLGPAQANELAAASEAPELDKFHDARVAWLLGYLLGPSCDGECKGRLVDIMLTFHSESQGRFSDALRALLRRSHAEVATAMARLHARLLGCQCDPDDLNALRDHVLIPALAEAAQKPKPDVVLIGDLLGLLALAPDPTEGDDDPAAMAAHEAFHAALDRARDVLKERFRGASTARRAAARTTRKNPPPALRKVMFCTAAEVSNVDADIGED